jgi:predicted nuclease of restriction endonuclease-like (RecB) superfamily
LNANFRKASRPRGRTTMRRVVLRGGHPELAALDAEGFAEVVEMIKSSRGRALTAVNTELVDLYWRVGAYIARKIEAADWGEGVVEQLARYIQQRQPSLKGFTRANLFRMRQFYETYRHDQKVAPLVRQLPWSHNLIILGESKRPEEREFYVRLAIREQWSRRELERQLHAAAFERTVLGSAKVSPAVRQNHPDAASIFKDSYVVEFLDLPRDHTEGDLHRGLVSRLKNFLIELGRDFCFVGSEYPLQVGKRDFSLDLLFFHRGLCCLCAIELKVGPFDPEHLGKLEFYLEALDRNVRKVHEGPSIGILLCASKDNEVVEYALSRSLSPTLIAQYQTHLPEKRLLRAKLHEFYEMTESTAAPGSHAHATKRNASPPARIKGRQSGKPTRKARKRRRQL